jgi:hypothetical protein
MQVLEAAIPPSLQRERTEPSNLPADYNPPFPAYCARFGDSAKKLVMAIIGAQSHQGMLDHDALDPVVNRLRQKQAEYSPAHWLIARFTDKHGADNRAVIAYWSSMTLYSQWCQETDFNAWWSDSARETEGHGWFRETLFPTMDRFETVFSDNKVPEGCAFMSEKMSGPMQEHVYWGSSRDRMPAAQMDKLKGEAIQTKADSSKRIKITGKSNLCIIRSGQDWSNTLPVERKLYLDTMHPVLVKGMDFLRDEGRDIGCYTCRFMSVLDPETMEADKDKTFGLAFFNDLGSLEKWSREHKTHLDIFHRFLQYAQELNNNVSLRLFHEILVLSPDQQGFEYVNCHNDSGLLVR